MNNLNKFTLAIDASRNRSGGAQAYIIGILSHLDPLKYGISEVHIWAFNSLLNAIPDRPWLIKHNPRELEMSLTRQLWWQATKLTGELRQNRCNVLFTPDASTLCNFQPMVVLSQDMLPYEPGAMKYLGYTKERIRSIILYFLQNKVFREAKGVIFLTKYSAEIIQQSCGTLSNVTCIPHGVGSNFKKNNIVREWPKNSERAIHCIYVSNAELYKHQWVVVEAIAALRKRGHNINITLIGGGKGVARKLLDDQILASDPENDFVSQLEFIPHNELPEQLASADIFVFASSCENMPITLIEGMSMGLPIVCSNLGPMPEVLSDAGVYCNPRDVKSVEDAIELIVRDSKLRNTIATKAEVLSKQYSWSRCMNETFLFINETYNSEINNE